MTTTATTTKPLKGKKLDQAVTACFYRHSHGVQIPIFDLGKITRDVQAAYATGGDMDAAMVAAIAKYRVG